MDKVPMHPQTGVPIVFNDQLSIISKHLSDIKLNIGEQNAKHQAYLQHIMPTINTVKSPKKRKKLTRKINIQHNDWSYWLESEDKQLNQYEAQGIFSEPTPIPQDANTLPFIWTYLVKDCGTKKAQGVYNGSPRIRVL